MKKKLSVLLAVVLVAVVSTAAAPSPPTSDRDQVLKVVQGFFDALATNNVESYRTLFVPGSQITAARNTPDGFSVRRRTIEDDLQKMPSNQNRLLERMWNPTVHVQGRVAAVWTPYDFHTNGRFSHSGVDIFNLLKTDAGWRIASVVYSVEPETLSQHPAGRP
jgi:hypothetical protein